MDLLAGKRKKRFSKCANPLFVKWLTEWRDEAQEKGWNSKYNYGKALNSLRKYPLPFEAGKDCKILEFFGDKICKMLDKKLEEHLKTASVLPAEDGTDGIDGIDGCSTTKHGNEVYRPPLNRPNAPRNAPSAAAGAPSKTSMSASIDSTDDDNNNDDTMRKKRRTSSREYIPAHRSAPYAIILSLFENHQSDHSPGFMLKKDLMRDAQKLADKSLSVPDAGSRYCGWSSMGSLIKKSYVFKEGNPARFTITVAGQNLARKILSASITTNTCNSTQSNGNSTQSNGNSTQSNGNSTQSNGNSTQSNGNSTQSNGNSTQSDGNSTPRSRFSSPDNSTLIGTGAHDISLSPSTSTHSVNNPSKSSLRQRKSRNSPKSDTNSKLKVKSFNAMNVEDSLQGDTEMIGAVKRFYTDDVTNSDDIIMANNGDDVIISRENSDCERPDYGLDEPRPGLQYVYIDEEGEAVKSKDRAAVTINEDLGVGFLIKCKYTDLLMSPKLYKLDNSRRGDGTFVFAYVRNEDAAEQSNPPLTSPLRYFSKTAKFASSTMTSEKSASSIMTSAKSASSIMTSAKSASSTMTSAKSASFATLPSNKNLRENNRVSNSISSLCPASKSVSPEIRRIKPSGHVSSTNNSGSSSSSIVPGWSHSIDKLGIECEKIGAASSRPSSTMDQFILHPGQYSILLCVDNREHFGSSGSCKQNLLAELVRNGVSLDVRLLSVGDFLWIAKEKVEVKPGELQMPASRELVLDFLVERKRLDDLCQSIKDGRFREQKFRMRQSGVRRPTYLVEAYGSSNHLGLPEDSLKQAVINSQIVDGFHIKHTRDQKETAAYLTVMTRILQKKLQNKELISCSRDEFDTYKDDLDLNVASSIHLLKFSEFNKLNVKNASITVRELFAKQLMALSGLSPERTAAVLRHYDTPMKLMRAYRTCVTESEKEHLLTNIKFGATNRNVGAAVSRLVYLLYNSNQALH